MVRSVWADEGFIGRDREDARPCKRYSSLTYGYYAARLAVLEHLARQGHQAGGVLAVLEISEAYWAPSRAPALLKPGRGISRYGKEDQDACGAEVSDGACG